MSLIVSIGLKFLTVYAAILILYSVQLFWNKMQFKSKIIDILSIDVFSYFKK